MKIVFLDSATLGAASLGSIRSLGELVCYPTSSSEEARERVTEADIIIVNKIKVTEELLSCAPKLRLICEAATGVNNIDLDAAKRRGIEVRNVAAYSTDSVVQLTFTQILALIVNPYRFDMEVKDGTYSGSGLFTDVSVPFMELSGKTIGIVGMGTIGKKVASIAVAFGMKVIYFSTSGTSHCREYDSVSLETLLRDSDVVSIHCPLNERTKGLLGKKELGLMRESSIVINMARGGIVDEAALSDAVGNGVISGAAVDVFTVEPLPESHPYLSCKRPDRLLLSPHVAWASREAISRLVDGIAGNIKSFTNQTSCQ